MQPDQPNNLWQHDHEDDPDIMGLNKDTDMYAPAQADDYPEDNTGQPSPEKHIIENEPIHWVANEYIHGERSKTWFIVFGVVVASLITIDLLFWKSYTFSILVVVMAAALIIYTRRTPQSVNYTLSGDQGLYIGEKLYHFNEFKSFGLIRDAEHHSIMMVPVKRFAPGVSVYFPDEAGEQIVDILGARLPMEQLKLDAVDIIVRKLHL